MIIILICKNNKLVFNIIEYINQYAVPLNAKDSNYYANNVSSTSQKITNNLFTLYKSLKIDIKQ
jgi:hypothetical protein